MNTRPVDRLGNEVAQGLASGTNWPDNHLN